MLRTHYVKRRQIHQCAQWGIQVSCVTSDLMRVTCGPRGLPAVWEWVSTGKQLDAEELAWWMKNYPVCKFVNDEDLHRRATHSAEASR